MTVRLVTRRARSSDGRPGTRVSWGEAGARERKRTLDGEPVRDAAELAGGGVAAPQPRAVVPDPVADVLDGHAHHEPGARAGVAQQPGDVVVRLLRGVGGDAAQDELPQEVVLLDDPVRLEGVELVGICIYPPENHAVDPIEGVHELFDELLIGLEWDQGRCWKRRNGVLSRPIDGRDDAMT